MSFGTKGCMYNCGDECTGECIGIEPKTNMRNSELVEFSGGKFFIDKKHTEEFHRLEEIYMDEDMSDEQPPEWEEAYNRMWEIVNTGIDVSS